MPKVAKVLSDMAVRKLSEPGTHFVGEVPGLAIQVLPSGAKTWILRAMIAGKRREMGLGGYPEVSLREARDVARSSRAMIREGKDPINERKAARGALLAEAAKAVTFKDATKAYIAAHEAGWANEKHRAQWAATLRTYADPVIGAIAVRDIQLAHVLQILEPIWTTKTETASRVRGRIEQILDSANSRGQIPAPWVNPARWRGHLDKLLPKPSRVAKPTHHRALPPTAVGDFMARLVGQTGMGARTLEFAILTAARSGEVRGATWSEIDLVQKTWTLPASRMKAGKQHRVPLSGAAVTLLKALPRIAGNDLLFPSANHGPLSDMTLSSILRRMEVPAVPHGFRSTFRDWAAEQTSYPNEVCEMALAHAVGNKVEEAYRRGDLLERRRALMSDWADFLAKPSPKSNNVSAIRDGARLAEVG